jgi:hypothetical protein
MKWLTKPQTSKEKTMTNAQVITKLLDEIVLLRRSCCEGISGEWEPSKDGFMAMVDGCDRMVSLANKLKAYSATQKLLLDACKGMVKAVNDWKANGRCMSLNDYWLAPSMPVAIAACEALEAGDPQ